MSVVLATDTYATILPVIERLRRQTVRERLEIVLVVPAAEKAASTAPDLGEFAAARIVTVDAIVPLTAARAKGVRAATAPLVFIGETHSYPHDGLTEALIEAHASPRAVVVPVFENANPDGALSWAAFLTDYGAWTEGRPAGEIIRVPAYNVAYRRSVLLEFGDRLEDVLAQGDQLVVALRERGHRAHFEPRARIDHANISFLAPWLHQRFVIGLVLAANRSAHWSRIRRLLYVSGSPLIPIVLLARTLGPVRRAARRQRLPAATLPAIFLGHVLRAVGEMIGYAHGTGASFRDRLDEYEVHKVSYTSGAPITGKRTEREQAGTA